MHSSCALPMISQERISICLMSKPLNIAFCIVIYSLAVINAVLLYTLYIEPYLFPEGLQPNDVQAFSVRSLIMDVTVFYTVVGIIVSPLAYHCGRKALVKQMTVIPMNKDRFGYVRDVIVLVSGIVVLPIVGLVGISVMLLCDSPQELLGSLLEGSALGPFVHGLCHGSPR